MDLEKYRLTSNPFHSSRAMLMQGQRAPGATLTRKIAGLEAVDFELPHHQSFPCLMEKILLIKILLIVGDNIVIRDGRKNND